MLALWDPIAGEASSVDRFAYVFRPPTQTEVVMGGGHVRIYTAVLQGADGAGPDRCSALPLEFLRGPFIMLKPNPSNTAGHAETYRFFSTPGKSGLL